MFNKLYKKFKGFITEHHNYLLFLLFLALMLNVRLPYTVYRPGGIIPLKNRIKVNNVSLNNNYYTSYVTVNEGTLMTVMMSYLFPNWDLERISLDKDDDSSYEKTNQYDVADLKSSNKVLQKFVLDKAGIDYEITNKKIVVISNLSGYENDLENNDIILKCNGNKVFDTTELKSCISDASDKDSVKLLIKRNNKEKEITAKLYLYHGQKIIGINIYNDYDIKSNKNIDILNDLNESGSSGSFITALAIYDSLTDYDYSKGKKISGTGSLDEDGYINQIGGIKYKLLGAEDNNIDVYFVPVDNYKEALEVKEEEKLKLNIVSVNTFDDAIEYLTIN